MAEMMMENGKGDGRGLLDALEAGLGEEDLADGDAVKTAGQRAVRRCGLRPSAHVLPRATP